MSFREQIETQYQVVAIGRQLVIVDVQKQFADSKKLLKPILDYVKGFDEIIFIWDTLYQLEQDKEGESHLMQMLREMKDSGIHVRMEEIGKKYGFLRGAMDTNESEQDIVNVLRFMLKHSLGDSRDIQNDHKAEWENYAKKFNIQYVPEGFAGDESESMALPDDVVDVLKGKIKQRPILIGGARDACLQEIFLVLKAMGLQPEINEKYTY